MNMISQLFPVFPLCSLRSLWCKRFFYELIGLTDVWYISKFPRKNHFNAGNNKGKHDKHSKKFGAITAVYN